MTRYIFDCDDVLLNWHGGFSDWCYARGHIVAPDPADYDISTWLGIAPHEARVLVARFNTSEAFGQLRPMMWAAEVLRRLARDREEVHVLTACGQATDTRRARVSNLMRAFPEIRFASVRFLPLGASKFETLYEMTRGEQRTIYVDDAYHHAESAALNGAEAFCVRRSHNRHFEAEGTGAVRWINNLSELGQWGNCDG